VIAVGNRHATHLGDLDAAAHATIFLERLIKSHNAVGKPLNLLAAAVVAGRLCIQQQCDNVLFCEERFEGDQFTTKPRTITGDQANLKEGIVNEAARVVLVNCGFDGLSRLVKAKICGQKYALIIGLADGSRR
jgi:hypothetical protein